MPGRKVTAPKMPAPPKHDGPKCQVCGCTETEPCNPPCGWAQPDLCTCCETAILALFNWKIEAHKPKVGNLLRRFKSHSQNEYERVMREAS
jgi:hypothetical protein